MHITVWNDYICPWAYAARPLTAWLRAEASSNGHTVEQRGFELHPELPSSGVAVRAGGRLDQVFDHIATECDAAGIEFVRPIRSPNTNRVLQITEIVRASWPAAFDEVDGALCKAHWVNGQAIDDPIVINQIISDAGVDLTALLEFEADGLGSRLLDESHQLAREAGATGTPAWLVNGMVITGLHPPEQFERWMRRILSRSSSSD